MTARRPEQTIQRALFQHLAWRPAPRTFAFHPANGGWRSPVEARIMKSLGVIPGVPDVFLVRDARAYALELKAEGGRLSDAQRQAHDALRAAGAEVAVAVGLDEALAWLERWGLLRGRVQ